MDHEVVVRQQMTEKYLLAELDSELRAEFEEHFFGCPDCALDIRAASAFVEQTKVVLAENSQSPSTASPTPIRVQLTSAQPRWFTWLRPAIAVPLMAALLVVVGYQNLVTVPQLRHTLETPQVLPFAAVNVGTWGSGGPAISAHPGEAFLLFVRIPPEGLYSRYLAELYNPAAKLEWSLTIPASSVQDQWPLHVPGANRESGSYTLIIHGITAAGESKEVGRASFELQVQK